LPAASGGTFALGAGDGAWRHRRPIPMRTMNLFLILSAASLLVMIATDLFLGVKAEFLNAFSAMQRLFGQVPSAGDSLVARKFGASGEFLVVLAVNLVVGGILTLLVRFFSEK
jgi:hypothetical protein